MQSTQIHQHQDNEYWSSHQHQDSYQHLDYRNGGKESGMWMSMRIGMRIDWGKVVYYISPLKKEFGIFHNSWYDIYNSITYLSTNSTSSWSNGHFCCGQNTLMRLLVDRRSLYNEWANCCSVYGKSYNYISSWHQNLMNIIIWLIKECTDYGRVQSIWKSLTVLFQVK